MKKRVISAETLRAKFNALGDMLSSGELSMEQYLRECAILNNKYTSDDDLNAVAPTDETAAEAPAAEPAAEPAEKASATIAEAAPVPTDCVAVPTILARAPIFRLDGSDDAATDWCYTAMQGVSLEYAGPTLGMRDAHIFHALLMLAMPHPAGSSVVTTRGALLKAAGLASGASSYAALEQSLQRLSRAHLTVRERDSRAWWAATLIVGPAVGDRSLSYQLDPRIVAAYTQGSWSSAKMPVFRAVNPGLASRMYMLLSQYPADFHHSVEGVMSMVGTSSRTPGDFAKLLRAALPKLEKAGAIEGWKIKADKGTGKLQLAVFTRPRSAKGATAQG